jgi:hypothetical protein
LRRLFALCLATVAIRLLPEMALGQKRGIVVI